MPTGRYNRKNSKKVIRLKNGKYLRILVQCAYSKCPNGKNGNSKLYFINTAAWLDSKNGLFYCCRKCMGLERKENKRCCGENNSFYGKHHNPENISGVKHWNYGNRTAPKTISVCENCGVEFEHHANGERIFCGLECKRDYDRSTRIIRKCAWCGELVERIACYKDQKHFFCDYFCLGKFNGNNQPSGKDAYWYGKRNEETPNWQGGLSREPYGVEFDNDLKEKVRDRDGYYCRLCLKDEQELENKLCAHHIDYNKKNNLENNLVSLCKSCHSKTNGNRKYWTNFFKRRVFINKKVQRLSPRGSTLQAYGSGSAGHPTMFMLGDDIVCSSGKLEAVC